MICAFTNLNSSHTPYTWVSHFKGGSNMIKRISSEDIALYKYHKLYIDNNDDISQLRERMTVVCHPGTSKFKGFYQEMAYQKTLFLDDDNFGYLTGGMLYPNWYFTPISLKIDLNDPEGHAIFQDICRTLPKTMMVHSGETGGVDFYYLTDKPALSVEFTLETDCEYKEDELPSIEMLGLTTDGKHYWLLLPSSFTKSLFRIIENELLINDYKLRMKRLSLAELTRHLDKVVRKYGWVNYFWPED